MTAADQDNTENDAGDDDEDDDDDEAADMEEFEESGMLEMVDPVRLILFVCKTILWRNTKHW